MAPRGCHRSRLLVWAGIGASFAAMFGTARPAFAHNAADYQTALRTWNISGVIVLAMLASSWWYHAGMSELRAHPSASQPGRPWHEVVGLLGLFLVSAALMSPIDALASLSISAHMVQHLLLALAAPLCLTLGRADLALVSVLPRRRTVRHFERRFARGRFAWLRIVERPAGVWVIFAATFWLWHTPTLYEAALRHPFVHEIEHLSLFVAGLAWFRVALRYPGRVGFGFDRSILWVATSALQLSGLSALLAFSNSAWYGVYAGRSAGWPISPVTDQQLAGVIAWAVATPIFLGLIAWLFARWFSTEERRAQVGQTRVLGAHEGS